MVVPRRMNSAEIQINSTLVGGYRWDLFHDHGEALVRNTLNHVVHCLRDRATLENDAQLTDGELLERYLKHRDEAAFEALVRRHGPMVLAVCRRVVNNSQDAEDAFQATFLVFVRKAASIRPRHMVGNWLY